MKKQKLKIMFSLLLSTLMLSFSAFAQNIIEPLPSNEVFIFSASVKDHQNIVAHWAINPGYYLYKHRVSAKVVTPQDIEIGDIHFPHGMPKYDDILGKYEVYQQQLDLNIPFNKMVNNIIKLEFRYQGCAENNYCYPPVSQLVTLDMNKSGSLALDTVELDNDSSANYQTEQEKITELLETNHIGLILLSFFGFGLLLSLTPCVLPMIPILSAIILGHGNRLSKKRTLALSIAYVLGMALTYGTAGLFAGYVGSNLQVAMQSPWVIIIFSLLFIALALSLMGLYDIHLPSRWQTRLHQLSQKQKAGDFLGVMLMGCLATLVVSPCVTPPLIAALAYLAKSGDTLMGGSALFTMGLGMGVPLIIVGIVGGQILPKAGAWMNSIKALFAILLLITAVVLLSRITPDRVVLILWASLCIIISIYLGLFRSSKGSNLKRLYRGIAVVFVIYGAILLVGASMGNTNPLQPLANGKQQSETPFLTIIKCNEDLDQQLAIARKQKRFVMLDFYADWCIACKDMDRKVFSNPEVREALKDFIVLQADVTLNDKNDKALQKRFNVIAPPTILFFDDYGNELPKLRIVGEMNAKEFLEHIEEVENYTKNR